MGAISLGFFLVITVGSLHITQPNHLRNTVRNTDWIQGDDGYKLTVLYKFETCSNANENQIRWAKNLNAAECQKLCDDHYQCAYFQITDNGGWCNLYRSCDERRQARNIGYTFEKMNPIRCNVTFEGGCKEYKDLEIKKYDIKFEKYSPQGCFWICLSTSDCAGFIIGEVYGECVLYKEGCTNDDGQKYKKYYSMDTCTNGAKKCNPEFVSRSGYDCQDYKDRGFCESDNTEELNSSMNGDKETALVCPQCGCKRDR